jgi:cyanophycin synthetase
MKINSITTLAGPNVHSHHPVLLMKLEGAVGSDDKHAIECAARELLHRAGIAVDSAPERGVTPASDTIVIPYRAEKASRHLLRAAVELVASRAEGRDVDAENALDEARRLIARYELGPSTRTIVEAAERRGIPCIRIGEDSIVQLGHGVRQRRIQAATTDRTSAIAVEISCDKQMTKSLLESASLPVPRGTVASTVEEAIAAFAEVGAPAVIKPLDGCQGKGVSLNVMNEDDVRAAFAIASSRGAVLVEEQIEGRNYRVLVVDGVMVAASERLPAHVVGDGFATVAELVRIANADPARGEGHEKPLTKIVIDEIAMQFMARAGVTLDTVPENGEFVWLREGVNLSTGGVARDVTDLVHPTVRRACERAARVVGLDICGVDLMTSDIARPLVAGAGAIIELNAAPGLRMHAFPSKGEPRDVGGAIVEMLFPADAPSRIPIVTITGTNGKTTVTRLVEHVVAMTGRRVGMTTTDGIWIGGECVAEGDTTGPQSARTVLGDPSVEFAVLETARGGIVRRGLGYDWSDVAIITNIQPDHFGQDGIESIEDLVRIKSLIAERVREGGTIVLNADDSTLVTLPTRPAIASIPRRIVYFTLDPANEIVRRHRASGGTAYLLRDGWLVEAVGDTEQRIVRADDMSMTINATATHQIANLLAAVAGCRASGLGIAQIATALLRFRSAAHNRGRSNLFRLPSGAHVLVDYGHNPEAFRAICTMASRWKGVRVTGIVGVPGDRNDLLIGESGRVAARGFDRIVIVEDRDRRGRRAGEVATLLCQAIKEEAPQRECMIVLDQMSALAQEIGRSGSSDVVVVFYEDFEPLVELLRRRGAVVVETLPRPALEQRPKIARADNGRSTPVARSA